MTTTSKVPRVRRKSGPAPRPAYPAGMTTGAGATGFPPPPPATTAAPMTPSPYAAQATPAQRELVERRERLSGEFAQGQWNLGGLLYEMAIRDHYRMDVIKFRAAKLQEIDAELGEIERLLRIDSEAAGGECDSCGALFGRGAYFCWQCGTPIAGSDSVGSGAAGSGAAGSAPQGSGPEVS